MRGAREVATTSDAAELLNVPPGRISDWRHRDMVKPVGIIPGRSRGGKGVALYDLRDLRPLADAYHQRKRDSVAGHADS